MLSLYAQQSTITLADFLYEKIYEELIAELDYNDFHIVCEYIKPIILSFRDDVMVAASELVYKLIKYRLSRNPTQINNDCKSNDTDILF